MAVGDLDAPGMPDGTEDRLLVVPPDSAHLEVVVPAERAGGGRGHPAVHEYEFEPSGDALSNEVLQHELAGAVLVGGGRHDQSTHWEAGHVDRNDALRALGAP